MSLNPNVLAKLRAMRAPAARLAAPPPVRAPVEEFIPDTEAGISETPDGEECARCGRTYPGNVCIPEGNIQLPVVEAAAASFWLSMDELKKVRGAAALKNPRDRELIQQVMAEYNFPFNTPPSQVLHSLLTQVWEGMCTSIGPDWTPTHGGWVCPGCAQRADVGESVAGLGGLGAELAGEERTGGEEDDVDLGELAEVLNLGQDD